MNPDFYKTKLLVAIEVSTQFGVDSAIKLVKGALNFPAVQKCFIVDGTTNQIEGSVEKNTEMDMIPEKYLDNIPLS